MTRKLKPYKVGDVYFRDGQLPLMLDREEQYFFVEIQGERVSAPTADECRKKAHEAWDRLTQLEWKKIIVISIHDGWMSSNKGTEISFNYSVHEIAESSNGKVCFERGANRVSVRVITGSPNDYLDRYHGPTKTSRQAGDYVLPWSPPLEAACGEIERRLVQLRDQIKELLGRSDAAELLETAVGRLLPAPEKGP